MRACSLKRIVLIRQSKREGQAISADTMLRFRVLIVFVQVQLRLTTRNSMPWWISTNLLGTAVVMYLRLIGYQSERVL